MDREYCKFCAIILSALFIMSIVGVRVKGGGGDSSKIQPAPTVSVRTDLSLFIYLGFLLLVLVTVVFAIIWLKKREIERYEDAVEDLKKQFDAGKISEETYKHLRCELEDRYYHEIKRMGF